MSEAKQQLLAVLREGTSQDYTRIKQAEEMLKQWENEPSFFLTLQDIFYDTSIPHDIRFLSGIYLKNGIDRFWRKTAKHPIDPEEKKKIRQRLLQFFEEPSRKLTAQNAVIISRIARIDYPREWPDVLSILLQTIQTSSTNIDHARIVHHRILETLYEVLTELSTRLLSVGKQQFAAISPNMFQALMQIYTIYIHQTTIQLNQLDNVAEEQLLLEIENTTICVKCLRILMVSGIRNVHKYDETKNFIEISYTHLQQYLNYRTALTQMNYQGKIREDLDSLIEEYGTLYITLQKAHPVSAVLCPAWLDIIRYYWQNIMVEGNIIVEHCKQGKETGFHLFQQFLLQGMLLIKDTIRHSNYSANKLGSDLLSVTDEEKELASEAGRMIHEQFLTPEFIHMCAETLVSQYMLLTPSDYKKWEEDPEGWANALDSENWEFELRPCAEMTLMTLLSQYRKELVPILLGLIERVATVNDQQGLLFKDAVYGAIGLGVNSLYGVFDFDQFVSTRLVTELEHTNPGFKILRRRIAWMLGKWVNEGVSADCRVIIYEILIKLMREEEDLVVRLTAAHGFKNAIDDWDFDIHIALPYLGNGVHLLLKLLGEIEDSDTIMKMISYLNAILDRTGEHMVGYAAQIVQLLTPIWMSDPEPLLKSSLVATFTKIMAIIGEQSVQLHDLFLPIVQYCTDYNNNAHVYLLEDGLDLWWTILQTTPSITDSLMSLYPVAIELLDYDTENLRKILKIIESYLLLDPQHCMSLSLPLFTKLGSKIMYCKETASSYITHTVDMVLQVAPLPVYSESLIQSGLLTNVLIVLLQDQLYGYAVMNYMNIFSRLSIYDPLYVIHVIQMTGQQQQVGDFFSQVLDKWMDKFDNISHIRSRKLACIGYTNIIQTGNPLALNYLSHLMAVWSDVGPELKGTDNEGLLYNEVDMEGDVNEIEDSLEKQRKNELLHKDPVYTIDLFQLMRQCIHTPSVHTLINQVDPTLLDQVKLLVDTL